MQQNIENELERQGEPQCQDDDDYEDLGYVPNEIENALRDFEGIRDVKQDDNFDLEQVTNLMNTDQRRIFDAVYNSVKEGRNICRKFVTDEAGTGKSFVIKCLVQSITK